MKWAVKKRGKGRRGYSERERSGHKGVDYSRIERRRKLTGDRTVLGRNRCGRREEGNGNGMGYLTSYRRREAIENGLLREKQKKRSNREWIARGRG